MKNGGARQSLDGCSEGFGELFHLDNWKASLNLGALSRVESTCGKPAICSIRIESEGDNQSARKL